MEVRPGYKQTEVGIIPEEWKCAPLKDIGRIKTGPFGTLLKADEYSGSEGTPLISVGEIGEGVVLIDNQTPLVPKPVVSRLPEYILEEGDIVFGRKGAVDRSAIITGSQAGYFLGSDGLRLRPAETLHAQYIAYQFQRTEIQSWLMQNASGTTMPSMNQEILGRVMVALAPLPEQLAIATAISDMDALLAKLDQLIAKKRDIKQAVMQQILTGKKRLPGFSGKWEKKKLGDVFEKIVGGGTPSRSNPNYWGNEIPWITVKDFASFQPTQAQEYITLEGLKHSSSNLIPAGTLITSTRMALGKAVIYDVDVCINQDLKALFPKPNVRVKYLYYWFEHNAIMINDLGSGSTVKGISLPDFKAVEFLLASLPEQTAIASVLSDMDADISALEARRDKTRALKQGMMQELLTGRIRLV